MMSLAPVSIDNIALSFLKNGTRLKVPRKCEDINQKIISSTIEKCYISIYAHILDYIGKPQSVKYYGMK